MNTGAWIVVGIDVVSGNGLVETGSEGMIVSIAGNRVEIQFDGFPKGFTHTTGVSAISEITREKR